MWRHADDPPVVRYYGMDEGTEARRPVLFLGDHAGFAIPRCLAALGLDEKERTSHIAGDHGVAPWLDAMVGYVAGYGLGACYSRLVVDHNRAPESEGWIASVSDGVTIRGNESMGEEERHWRKTQFFDVWHKAIDDVIKRAHPAVIVALHSFTPALKDGVRRRCAIGLLHNGDRRLADILATFLRAESSYHVSHNEPYDGRFFNYTLDRHALRRAIPHVSIEVRSDLLLSPDHGPRVTSLIGRGVVHAGYCVRARHYRRIGYTERAVDMYNEAIAHDPHQPSYYVERARAYQCMGRDGDALTDYGTALRLEGHNAEYYGQRGDIHGAREAYERAIEEYTRAIQCDKRGTAEYHIRRGQCYKALKAYGDAMRDYDKALNIKPRQDVYYYERALLYVLQGDDKRAIEDFSRAIQHHPHKGVYDGVYYARYYAGRGMAYGRQHDDAHALEDVTHAIGLHVNHAPYYVLRSMLYKRMGAEDKARQDMMMAKEIQGDV